MQVRNVAVVLIILASTACANHSDLTYLDPKNFDGEVNSGYDGRPFIPTRFLQRNQSKINAADTKSPSIERYSYLYDISFINSVAIDRRKHNQQVAYYFFEPAEIEEHVLLHGGIEVKFDLCSEELISITEVRTES